MGISNAVRSRRVLKHLLLLLTLWEFRAESFLSSYFLSSSSFLAATTNQRSDQYTNLDLSSRSATPNGNLTTTKLHQKQPQQRRPHTNRRPRKYWSNFTNFEREVAQFWLDRGIYNEAAVILIPSESILFYYNRHDIRGAIASVGGRDVLAASHQNIRILPGKWVDAVEQYPQLLVADPELASRHTPWNKEPANNNDGGKIRWQHSSGRREKGYWNITSVFKELYNYTYRRQQEDDRPCIWMPRLSELAKHGRSDLKQAIQRFHGYDGICRRAGMISYKEWAYFEGQLCLLLELREYCDVYQNGDYNAFPCVSDVERNGYTRLHSLIQYYGGRNFLSLKLGMVPSRSDYGGGADLISFGAFDLMLAIQLLLFVRSDQLRKTPPLKHRVIAMPSADKLRERCENGEWIHDKICEYGGYENVARRLGLAI